MSQEGQQQTRTFVGKMIQRKWKIEGLFAEAKQFHGVRRARYRRLNTVSIQALMAALAQNIKRVVDLSPYLYWLWKSYVSVVFRGRKLATLPTHFDSIEDVPRNAEQQFVLA